MMRIPTLETVQKYARTPLTMVEGRHGALDTVQKYAKTPLTMVEGRHAARSGLVAGAAVIALSAASAAVTALRERSTRS
jgi:hypothetical protein